MSRSGYPSRPKIKLTSAHRFSGTLRLIESTPLFPSMEKKMQEEVVVLALREPGAAFSGATGLTKGLATGEAVPAAGTRPDSFPRTAGRGMPPQQRGKRSRALFLALVRYGEAVTLVPPAGRDPAPGPVAQEPSQQKLVALAPGAAARRKAPWIPSIS